MPRHTVITSTSQYPFVRKRFIFPPKTAFVKYCPGEGGSVKTYNEKLSANADPKKEDIIHNYKFVLSFRVSLIVLCLIFLWCIVRKMIFLIIN